MPALLRSAATDGALASHIHDETKPDEQGDDDIARVDDQDLLRLVGIDDPDDVDYEPNDSDADAEYDVESDYPSETAKADLDDDPEVSKGARKRTMRGHSTGTAPAPKKQEEKKKKVLSEEQAVAKLMKRVKRRWHRPEALRHIGLGPENPPESFLALSAEEADIQIAKGRTALEAFFTVRKRQSKRCIWNQLAGKLICKAVLPDLPVPYTPLCKLTDPEYEEWEDKYLCGCCESLYHKTKDKVGFTEVGFLAKRIETVSRPSLQADLDQQLKYCNCCDELTDPPGTNSSKKPVRTYLPRYKGVWCISCYKSSRTVFGDAWNKNLEPSDVFVRTIHEWVTAEWMRNIRRLEWLAEQEDIQG